MLTSPADIRIQDLPTIYLNDQLSLHLIAPDKRLKLTQKVSFNWRGNDGQTIEVHSHMAHDHLKWLPWGCIRPVVEDFDFA